MELDTGGLDEDDLSDDDDFEKRFGQVKKEAERARHRCLSMVDHFELEAIFEQILEREQQEKMETMTNLQKLKLFMVKLTYKNYYFESIFPSTKI